MFNESFRNLKSYCESQNYAGWDPYDGLNSRVFQTTPLKHWDFARLAWIQAFKRLPVNLRPVLMVPKGHNAKGIGLFLRAYCNLYNLQALKNDAAFGTAEELLNQINTLAELLISLKTKGYSGTCWGYNFDWQARGGLFFPSGTPTVVATTYAAFGLMDAYDITGNQKYLDEAVNTADFVLNDLKRTFRQDGNFIFSYSPTNGNNTVYNASLLGSKLLARVYAYTNDNKLLEPAKKSVQAVVNSQQDDGSWVYGELPIQNWIDSYHTGFNLESLRIYQKYTGDTSVETATDKGFDFYINSFFLEDGTPKYYHNKIYPVDIHSPAQLIITLSALGKFEENIALADRVLSWSIKNMQHPAHGYFYYQIKKGVSSKIPYMRWSQAWMMYALSLFIIEENKKI